MSAFSEKLTERFRAKLELQGECWVWIGSKFIDGYGNVKIAGRNYRAHRVAYEAVVGPIPPGLQIDHLCRVRACCNPDHLEPVTQTENVRRGAAPAVAGAWQRAKVACPRGHAYSPENTRVARGKRACRKCEAEWARRARLTRIEREERAK